jgi:hypothetical protein
LATPRLREGSDLDWRTGDASICRQTFPPDPGEQAPSHNQVQANIRLPTEGTGLFFPVMTHSFEEEAPFSQRLLSRWMSTGSASAADTAARVEHDLAAIVGRVSSYPPRELLQLAPEWPAATGDRHALLASRASRLKPSPMNTDASGRWHLDRN